MTRFNLINTNAHSLKPKLTSLLDAFNELETDVTVITETWLQDRTEEGLEQGLSLGSGLGILTRNRCLGANGVAYGGVAVVWRENIGKFSEVVCKNPDKFEVFVAAGSLKGHSRKIIVVACYLPPGYNKIRGQLALDYIEARIVDMKKKYQDPYIVVAGNFNQWKIGDALANFQDLREVEVGATQGSRAIDNFTRSVVSSGTLDPLETEGEDETAKSDHRLVYCSSLLERRQAYRWETYSYRLYNEDSVGKFKEWVVMHDWDGVLSVATADDKAEEYQRTVVEAVDSFFPLRTTKRKNTDPPWMNKKMLKMIDARKQLFIEEGGRTAVWKEEKKRVDRAVRDRKRGYMDILREHLLDEDAARNFYRHVKSFGKAEKPKLFDVRDLMPDGQANEETADLLAEYYNCVSMEFDPLGPGTCLVPGTRSSMYSWPPPHIHVVHGAPCPWYKARPRPERIKFHRDTVVIFG